MGTKSNPGAYDCYARAEDNEPMFVLLARDPGAPVLVRLWAELRAILTPDTDAHKLNEADYVANAMEQWAAGHPDHGPLAR